MDKCPGCKQQTLRQGTSAGAPIVFCRECGFLDAGEPIPAPKHESANNARKSVEKNSLILARPAPCPSEHEEQVALFKRIAMHTQAHPELAAFFAVPNGAQKTRAAQVWFWTEGLRAGVPDVIGLIPRHGYHGITIEMKRRNLKRENDPFAGCTPEQIEYVSLFGEHGYYSFVAYGMDEAWEQISEYIEL